MVTKKKNRFFKSLRFRIMVILVILGIVPGIIVTQLMVGNYKQQALEVRTGEIRTQCAILCNQIIRENYLNDPSSESINSKLEVLSNTYGGRIMLVDRDFKVVKDTYNVDEGKILISPKVVKCFKSGEATDYSQYGQTLELAVPVRSADVPQMQGAMLINISTSAVIATVSELEQRGMLIVGIIIVLSVFLAYILAAVLVKPLARVTKSIEDLTDGYQKDEISVPDYTETELITDAFNKMLTRMKVLDESRSEFVSNVSHELKTPIALIQGYAEGLKEGINDDPESTEFYCDVIIDEAGKMNRMVKNLLTLNQLEFGTDEVEFERFDIVKLVKGVIASCDILIQQVNANVDFIADETAYVWADEFKTDQVVRNYLTNAIHHVGNEKRIEVKIVSMDGKVCVSVFNSGKPIPEEDVPKLWDKFYKVDKAHTREYGGNGIGLSIVKAIMESFHQGYGVKNYDNGVEFWFELDAKCGKV